ncbi:MAG: aminotransferase class V [Sandaracinus sp.]|nr:aminotransferase class V [Sandaracinus sp.]
MLAGCTYLNSCSTGAFPVGMRAALDAHWATLSEWRDEVWASWWPAWLAFADELAAFLGAPSGSVVTGPNASALVARLSTAVDFAPGKDEVVLTELAFPSAPFLWRAHGRRGAKLVRVPAERGAVEPARLLEAIGPRTRLVQVSHGAFRSGAVLPLEALVTRCREVDALLVVDAYQTLGTMPMDVTELGVDVVLGGAHKWLCGALDLGFMYVRPEVAEALEPTATGWVAGDEPLRFEESAGFAAGARRFAAGTPAVLPCLSSKPGLAIVREVGVARIRAQSLRQTGRLRAAAEALGAEVFTPAAPEARGGVVSFSFGEAEDAAIFDALRARGFVFSVRRGLRVAPHFYNTDDEIEAFTDALEEVVREQRA